MASRPPCGLPRACGLPLLACGYGGRAKDDESEARDGDGALQQATEDEHKARETATRPPLSSPPPKQREQRPLSSSIPVSPDPLPKSEIEALGLDPDDPALQDLAPYALPADMQSEIDRLEEAFSAEFGQFHFGSTEKLASANSGSSSKAAGGGGSGDHESWEPRKPAPPQQKAKAKKAAAAGVETKTPPSPAPEVGGQDAGPQPPVRKKAHPPPAAPAAEHKEHKEDEVDMEEEEEKVLPPPQKKENAVGPDPYSVPVNPAMEEQQKKYEELDKFRAEQLRATIDAFVSSEESYYRDLNTLNRRYLRSLKRPSEQEFLEITADQVATIFGEEKAALTRITDLHTNILDDLLDDDEADPLGVIAEYGEGYEAYVDYASNFDQTLYLLHKLGKNKKFLSFLRLTRLSTGSLDLMAYLIQPAQHVMTTAKLFGDVVRFASPSHPQYGAVQGHAELLNRVCEHVSERLAKWQHMAQVLSVQNTITGLEQPFVHPHRRLIKDARLGVLKPRVTLDSEHPPLLSEVGERKVPVDVFFDRVDAAVFLFNDMLLWTSASYKYESGSRVNFLETHLTYQVAGELLQLVVQGAGDHHQKREPLVTFAFASVDDRAAFHETLLDAVGNAKADPISSSNSAADRLWVDAWQE